MAVAAVSQKNWQWGVGPPTEPTPDGWRYHLITFFVDTTTGRKEGQVYDVDVLHSDTPAQQRDKMAAAAVAAGAAAKVPFVVTIFGYEPFTFIAV